MSVKIDGKLVFTKEMANVFQAKVIECPDCGFCFDITHELDGNDGLYSCPSCNEDNLLTEIYHLKRKDEIYKERLERVKAIVDVMEQSGDIDLTTLTQLRLALEWLPERDGVESL